MTDARVMTKATAMPMPTEVSMRLDTPRKGQMPRNLLRTKLLKKIAPKKIINSSIACLTLPLGHCRVPAGDRALAAPGSKAVYESHHQPKGYKGAGRQGKN